MIKEFSKYTISTIITRGISIITMLIITSFYSVEEYGLITLGNTYLTLFYTLFAFGLCEGTQRFYQQLRKENKEYIISDFLIFQFVLFLVFFIIFVFLYFFSNLFQELPLNIVILVLVTGYLKALQNIFFSILQMENLSNKYSSASIIIAIFDVFFIFIFVYILKCSVYIRFVSLLFCNLICSVIMFLYVKNIISVKPKYDKELLHKIFKFCFPCMLLPLVSWFLTSSDKIFLSKIISIESVGGYGFINTICSLITIFFIAFNTAFTPIFYAEYSNKIKIRKLQTIFMCGYVYLAVILLVALQVFLNIIPSFSKYKSGLYLAPLFLGSLIINSFSSLNVSHLAYSYRSNLLLVITSISGIINIILNYFFVSNFGQKGAAIALLVSFLIQCIITLLCSLRFGYCSFSVSKVSFSLLLFICISVLFEMKLYIIQWIFVTIWTLSIVIIILKEINRIQKGRNRNA